MIRCNEFFLNIHNQSPFKKIKSLSLLNTNYIVLCHCSIVFNPLLYSVIQQNSEKHPNVTSQATRLNNPDNSQMPSDNSNSTTKIKKYRFDQISEFAIGVVNNSWPFNTAPVNSNNPNIFNTILLTDNFIPC